MHANGGKSLQSSRDVYADASEAFRRSSNRGAIVCGDARLVAAPFWRYGSLALEPVSVSHADTVHAFVVFLGVGVRHVLEIDRDVVVGVEVVAHFHRNMKEHA